MSAAAMLVFRNGKIVTVERAFSIAEAVAIGDSRVLHVGRSLDMQLYIWLETLMIHPRGNASSQGSSPTCSPRGRAGLTPAAASAG